MTADHMRREAVNRPAHYGGADNPHECIKVLRAWMTLDEFAGFLKGNAIKYLCRGGKKGPKSDDLEKARQYLDWLIELEDAGA